MTETITAVQFQDQQPKRKSSHPEHNEQVALFKWVRNRRYAYPQLCTFHAIPNAAKRGVRVAAYMKAEGLLSGVFDTFWPYASCGYHGLYIEMKFGNGKLSTAQEDFMEAVTAQGYLARVCYSAIQATLLIEAYIKGTITS